jgi:SprT protein
MPKDKITEVISKYVPAPAVETCVNWIMTKNIHLKITRGRASKFGDYMPLRHGEGHRITVNHDLNKYSFLVTFTHEVAHLETFSKFRNRVDPHGLEWKNEFKVLLADFIRRDIFPDDIRDALTKYMINPAASSCSDVNLLKTLRKYDQKQEQVFHLEDLPDGIHFTLHQSRSGLVFRKGHKIRTRFHCKEINSNKVYLVSAIAEVEKFEVRG